MIHFFRSSTWSLESLHLIWAQVVHHMAPLVYRKNRVVLVGDGMKHAKEGRRIAGVKKLQQASGNSSKEQVTFSATCSAPSAGWWARL
jgi:hypothetical protein